MNINFLPEFQGQVQAIPTEDGTLVFAKCGSPDLPPLLMVHGWLESKAVWRRVLPHLENGYFCVAPDFLGHGDSDKPPEGDYSIPAQAGRIMALADALNLSCFALAGHSMGGMMALYVAARLAPGRVTRVVNFSGVIHDPNPLIGAAVSYLTDIGVALPIPTRLLQAAARLKGGKRIIASMVYGSLDHLPRDFEIDVQDALREGIDIPGFRSLEAIEKMDLRPYLADIRCPVLTIHGEQDNVVSLQQARTAGKLIPNHHLLAVPNCGHYPMLENWRYSLPELLRFLGEDQR
jgi:pimeloyl-ACP methyl ester carboxylesterase